VEIIIFPTKISLRLSLELDQYYSGARKQFVGNSHHCRLDQTEAANETLHGCSR